MREHKGISLTFYDNCKAKVGKSQEEFTGVRGGQGIPAKDAPSSNTGGLVTSVSLDWLSITIPSRLMNDGYSALGVVRAALLDSCVDMDLVEARSGGHLGWHHSAKIADGAIVAWGGQNDTGRVDLSGGALGALRALGLDIWAWIDTLMACGVRVTRIDIAADDRQGVLTYKRISKHIDTKSLVTRSRKVDEWKTRVGGKGWTFYVGRGGASVLTRIYDKASEQGLKGVHWVRVESQFRKRKAHAVAVEWCARGWASDAGMGLIRSAVDFRKVNKDSNKTRRPLLKWWASFVSGASIVRATAGRIDRTIEDTARWLHKGVSGALAAFESVYGIAAVRRLLSHGHDIMSVRHKRLIALSG